MTETVAKLSLLGVLPAQVLLSQLDGGALAPGVDRGTLLAQWQASSAGFRQSGEPSRSFVRDSDLRPLPARVAKDLKEVLGRASNYQPFDSHPLTAAIVPLAKLVTPQLTVNLERIRRRGPIVEEASLEDLVRYMFHSSVGAPELSRQTLGIGPNGGALMFTTYDEDVRLHQPPMYQSQPINDRDPQAQKLETICFPVGGGTPFPYAMRVPILPGVSRLVLANGIHRTAAAALSGVKEVPILLSEFQPVEVPDPFVETPRQLLLDPNANAPTIVDFANKSVAIELQYYRQLRTVRFNWNFESYLLSVR